MKTLKAIVNFLLGLLAVAKWLPFLGRYKEIVLVASTVLSAIAGMITKCDAPSTPQQPTTPVSSPTPTPIHTPSPSPTPTPIVHKIILDRQPFVSQPFTVRYTAPYEARTHLWADKWRLGYMGRDTNGQFILYAVTLRNAGKRLLTVRNAAGDVLASKMIEVKNGK